MSNKGVTNRIHSLLCPDVCSILKYHLYPIMSPAEPFFSARINGPPKIELLIIFCHSSYKYFLQAALSSLHLKLTWAAVCGHYLVWSIKNQVEFGSENTQAEEPPALTTHQSHGPSSSAGTGRNAPHSQGGIFFSKKEEEKRGFEQKMAVWIYLKPNDHSTLNIHPRWHIKATSAPSLFMLIKLEATLFGALWPAPGGIIPSWQALIGPEWSRDLDTGLSLVVIISSCQTGMRGSEFWRKLSHSAARCTRLVRPLDLKFDPFWIIKFPWQTYLLNLGSLSRVCWGRDKGGLIVKSALISKRQ